MALGIAALGLKSLFGGKKPPNPGQTVKMPEGAPTPAQTAPPSEPVVVPKAPKVKRVTVSSPLFKKTDITSIDKSLQNISKSLGNIKGSVQTDIKFKKEKQEEVQKGVVKKRRERREKEQERGGMLSGFFGGIKSAAQPGLDWMQTFLVNVIVGAIAVYLIKNIQKVIDFVKDVIEKLKEVVKWVDDIILTPVWDMAKAIVGPIFKLMQQFGILPDFKGEENELLKLANDLTLKIPILGDHLKTLQDQIRKMKLDLDVQDKPVEEKYIPPSQRPDYQAPPSGPRNPFRNQPGGVYTGERQEPSSSSPSSPPSGAAPSGGGQGGGKWQPVLELIAKHEAVNGSYDSIYPSSTKPGLTNMTIAEADAWQAATASQRGSAAAGRYQFMYIKDQAAAAGIGPNEKFSPENQDKMAISLITKTRGVTWNMIKKNPNEAMIRLGMEWASLPMPVAMQGHSRYVQAGQSYYAGDGLNKAGASVKEVKDVLGAAQVTPPARRPDYRPKVQPQTPMMGEAYATGLKTAQSQFIGGSSDYHIDTKFPDNLPIEQSVAMVDQMSRAYAQQGRVIEFSNSAVQDEVYDHNASYSTKLALLKRVFSAHAPRGGWRSMDYYIPLKKDSERTGGRGRFIIGGSAERAEIVTPTMPGGSIEYHEGGKYGSFVVVVDANGKVISKTGHGDIRDSKAGTIIRIPRTQNNQSRQVDRSASYETTGGREVVMVPVATPQPTGAGAMMSGRTSVSTGGGGGNAYTYLTSWFKNKLYKQ